jgi:hypothetical protein
MTARPPLLFALVVTYGVGAYAMGRGHAPTRTIESTRVLRVERTATASTSAAQTEQHQEHVEGKERIVTRWRTAPSPGCTPSEVVRIEYREAERETRTALLASSESKATLTSTAEHREISKTVERERPRYAVGVDGGLMFTDATALVRGRFEIRALGPLWITAWGDRYAAGAGARLEW